MSLDRIKKPMVCTANWFLGSGALAVKIDWFCFCYFFRKQNKQPHQAHVEQVAYFQDEMYQQHT